MFVDTGHINLIPVMPQLQRPPQLSPWFSSDARIFFASSCASSPTSHGCDDQLVEKRIQIDLQGIHIWDGKKMQKNLNDSKIQHKFVTKISPSGKKKCNKNQLSRIKSIFLFQKGWKETASKKTNLKQKSSNHSQTSGFFWIFCWYIFSYRFMFPSIFLACIPLLHV